MRTFIHSYPNISSSPYLSSACASGQIPSPVKWKSFSMRYRQSGRIFCLEIESFIAESSWIFFNLPSMRDLKEEFPVTQQIIEIK